MHLALFRLLRYAGRSMSLEQTNKTPPRALVLLAMALLSSLGGAFFPRLAYRMRWPSRAGPRGLIAYVILNTAVNYALRYALMDRVRAWSERYEGLRDELRLELGREPTEEEMQKRWSEQ